jgi:hypothetical protein
MKSLAADNPKFPEISLDPNRTGVTGELMSKHDYALHDAISGKGNEIARRKRWWMQKLIGPQRRKYARMLMGLPPVRNTCND